MKKSFKRVGVVFIILLSILGIQSILQKGCCVKAATLGDFLGAPEDGWQRYYDNDKNIVYDNNWELHPQKNNMNGGAYHHNMNTSNSGNIIVGAKAKFEFYGTKIRIITVMWERDSGANVKIDGVDCGNYRNDLNDPKGRASCLFFEKQDLKETLHKVEITTLDKSAFSPQPLDNWFELDAIDIDKDGELVPYNEKTIVTSLSINKNTDALKVGESDILTAKILPENAYNQNIKWMSSDESVATVDNNGKVIAIKEGTTKITASTTDGTRLSDSCEVTVKEVDKMRVVLTITMTNNAIKTYDLSKEELDSFLNWYDAKSKGTATAYYVFENKASGGNISNKDYIPYDKIEYFNIQEYKA